MATDTSLTETLSSSVEDDATILDGTLRRAAVVAAAVAPLAACGASGSSPTTPTSTTGTGTTPATTSAPRPLIEHLLRRAGFSASPDEIASYAQMGYTAAVDALLNYDAAV